MAAYSTKRMLFSQLFAVLVLNPSTRSTRAFHLYNRGIYSWSMKTLLFCRENNELELGVNINQTFHLVIVFLSLHKLLTHKMLLSMFTVFTVKVQLDTFSTKSVAPCMKSYEKRGRGRIQVSVKRVESDVLCPRIPLPPLSALETPAFPPFHVDAHHLIESFFVTLMFSTICFL